MSEDIVPVREPAPAKINLALHVRGRMADGRHALETIFAFCTDGDRVEATEASSLSLTIDGPFAGGLSTDGDNLVLRAGEMLRDTAGSTAGAELRLTKNLPVASGIGGGSADAAAALRALTALWRIDPAHASTVAPKLGADVPACLLSMTARGEGAGDRLQLVDDPRIAGTPILLVNPLEALSTGAVFALWDGTDVGPLDDWMAGRNDLEPAAREIVPAIGDILDWMGEQDGVTLARMSGSGATCFALFHDEPTRDGAAAACPPNWWHLATNLR
ncbi:4-(cytidine 5'-diphospho)-2-C-methyl-D-erythritol kinase [Sphingomonas sp. LY160]|uniref:4-(cytidine 5'-diphospho)-2-C-methyl-D-erythritol kinase n=1 Tax=Sphingomonas sp. LY160 TaxID=3095342 RepID=UPI002ADECB2A|nr:4-(cytidine 5'-diphospho)-2-C-methyl-D-erythritol kinase [Sphingomonas sp. LY160]MEA1071182.1 4-(cytidine 5'-diphospho)-2-C-methyl-D-erythritol kinase [Sphingomonas sp. LY160]